MQPASRDVVGNNIDIHRRVLRHGSRIVVGRRHQRRTDGDADRTGRRIPVRVLDLEIERVIRREASRRVGDRLTEDGRSSVAWPAHDCDRRRRIAEADAGQRADDDVDRFRLAGTDAGNRRHDRETVAAAATGHRDGDGRGIRGRDIVKDRVIERIQPCETGRRRVRHVDTGLRTRICAIDDDGAAVRRGASVW